MYGKAFQSMYSGSMMGAGADVFAVWGYVIANAVNGAVELNPVFLSAVIGMTPDRAQAAIDVLCAPDARSRTKDEDGRRLVREGQFAYRVVNHEKYRAIRDEDQRRDYMRDYMRNRRAEQKRAKAAESVKRVRTRKPRVNSVNSPLAQLAHTEAEAEAVTTSTTTLSAKKPRKAKQAPASRPSWLTPYIETWEARHGAGSAGTLAGRLAKALRPLDSAHGADVVAKRLAWYLREAEPRFQSVEKFAQTFAQWDPDAPGFTAEEIGGFDD